MFNGNYLGSNKSASTIARSSASRSLRSRTLGRGVSSDVLEFGTKSEEWTSTPGIQEQAPSPDQSTKNFPAAPADPALGLSKDILEVGSVPLLSREDEVELAARIKRGDEAARERMIRANLRLVIKIARDYENLGLPLADLVSEGIIGLMKAVDRFDPAKGGKLSTYGSWWIKQQIRRGLANQGRTIRLPVHVEGKLYQLSRAEIRLRNLLGREATDEELASEMNMTPRRIARLRQSSAKPVSLDARIGDQDTTTAEVVADERTQTPYEEYENKVDREVLRKLLSKLSTRESKILRFRFGLDGGAEQTLEQVGKKFGLTRERIRQVQNEAFKKLRYMMEETSPLPLAA